MKTSSVFKLGKIIEGLSVDKDGKLYMDCIDVVKGLYQFSFPYHECGTEPSCVEGATCTLTVPSIVVIEGMSEINKRDLPVIGSRFLFCQEGTLIDVIKVPEEAFQVN